jgi:glycosyl transferase family 87
VKARIARGTTLGLAGLGLGFVVLLACTFSTNSLGDYGYQVAPAMNALLDGDLSEFFRIQPVYGGFSTLARLPFSALGRLAGGGEQLVFQFGVLPCLMALGLAGLGLLNAMRHHGQAILARFVVGFLLLANPVTLAAIQRGHPEELLAAALVLGAALAAVSRRPFWAAVLLGLALGTKQWALLAVIPVLVACGPGFRIRTALIAGLVAVALTVPMAVADSGQFVTNNKMAQGGWGHASRLSVWWPLGSPQKVGAEGSSQLTVRKLSKRWTAFARPSVVVVALVLALAFWLRRRGLVPADTLGLLALLLLLRCLLDPMNNDYYHVPFLTFLVAWEGIRVRGLPVMSLLAAAALWATTRSPWLSPESLGEQFYLVNNVFYLSCMVPLAGWLAWALFSRRSAKSPPAASLAPGRVGMTRTWIREPQSSPL